jgi:hypothetical protein
MDGWLARCGDRVDRDLFSFQFCVVVWATNTLFRVMVLTQWFCFTFRESDVLNRS